MVTKEYDLICSLGGNCSAANALRYRNMRYYSLPFDWCYMIDDKPIKALAECFENNSLKQIAQKENLVLLSDKEEKDVRAHSNTIHYKDIYSGYYFVNHFYKTLEDGGYDDFRKKFDKRIKRLIEYIDNSNSILFVLATAFEIEDNSISYLQDILKKKYPNKTIDFEIIEFGCKEDKKIQLNNNLTINKYIRKINDYDFLKTNYEWSFLDNIYVTCKFRKKISFLKRILIELCPFKKLRIELRRIYYTKELKCKKH